jgi:hypothetical protein
MFTTSEQITEDYKNKFKELLRQSVGELDSEFEDKCAEAAWQSFGWQTLQMLSRRESSRKSR